MEGDIVDKLVVETPKGLFTTYPSADELHPDGGFCPTVMVEYGEIPDRKTPTCRIVFE